MACSFILCCKNRRWFQLILHCCALEMPMGRIFVGAREKGYLPIFSNAIWHSLFWRFLGVWENRHLPNAHLIIFRAMNLLQLGWQYRAWLARHSCVHHYSLLCFLRFSTRFSKLSCFYVIIYIKVEFLFSQELTS